MRRRTRVLAALAGALLVAAVLLAINLPAARMVFAVAVCLLLPGLGWARKMRYGDLGDTAALAVALSICATVAIGTAMAVSDSWSPGWGLAALGAIALAGFVPGRLLRPVRSVVTVSEPWVDWYSDVDRRAAEARTREAAAMQMAIDE